MIHIFSTVPLSLLLRIVTASFIRTALIKRILLTLEEFNDAVSTEDDTGE
jgi:hypothetical protein